MKPSCALRLLRFRFAPFLFALVFAVPLAAQPVLKRINISPASATIDTGQAQQFTVTATFEDNSSEDITGVASYQTSKPDVAVVSDGGLATGMEAGKTKITASYLGKKDEADLSVQGGPKLRRLSLDPPSATIVIGGVQEFTVIGTFEDGSTVDLTSGAFYSSSQQKVALAGIDGSATGVAAGKAKIIATYQGKHGEAELTVSAEPKLESVTLAPVNQTIGVAASLQYTATAHFKGGSNQNVTALAAYKSSHQKTAVISPAGAATGVARGKTKISATYMGKKGETDLTVTGAGTPNDKTLDFLTINPAAAAIQTGATQPFTVTGTFKDGTTQNLTAAVSFSSSKQNVALVGTDGIATGISAGEAKITASLGPKKAEATLTVTGEPKLVSIAISPGEAEVAVGRAIQFTVTATLKDGSTHDVTSAATYSSDRQHIALAGVGGTATGVTEGTARIKAEYMGKKDEATLMIVSAPPLAAPIVIVSPSPGAATREQQIEVRGLTTLSTNAQIRIEGGASNVVVMPGADGSFVLNVPLVSNRKNRLYAIGVDTDGSPTAPVAIDVTQDAQPPSLFVDFPPGDAVITTDTVDVAGRVGDMLTGFMGLAVTVNGLPANVVVGIGNNGSFEKTAVPLMPGTNVIEAVAMDQLGNTATRRVTITHVPVPPNANRIVVVSGNSQTAPIGTVLPVPVVVQLLRGDGSPFMDKLVKFKVTRSDGRLGADGAFATQMEFIARTDAAGFAQAHWKLGGTAGCGVNRLEVTSKDILGSAFLCASATPGPAAQINIGSGNNQRVETGALAIEPLRAWVSDSCNGIEGIPVTFRVIQGGGLVNGSASATVPTTRTGHAEVHYRLGPDAGNQLVEASFTGHSNSPATFVLYAIARDTNQPTAFSGLVLDNASRPIGGAHCVLDVGGLRFETHTDPQGQFNYSGIPSGPAHLHVDGLTATNLAGQTIPQGSYPSLAYTPVIVPNANNTLPMPVLLPKLNPNNARLYTGASDVVLTCEGMAGLRMIVKAGSMRRADGTIPTAANPAILALNQVHHDDVPMPMPDGVAPPFAWTLQPGGATFDPPIQIEYPNMTGLPAGGIAYFLSFNHDTERFEIVSSGHVTDDSTTIVTDPGGGLSIAGWGCNCPPYSVTANCKKCNIFVTGPKTVCIGKSVTYKAKAVGAGTIKWTITGGGATPSTGTGSSITTLFKTVGSVTVEADLTCKDGLTDQHGVNVSAEKPNGETTTGAGFSGTFGPTVALFASKLTPASLDCSGISVAERDGGTGADGCWFVGSTFSKFDMLTSGTWSVGAMNAWMYDNVGWFSGPITYYRTHPAGSPSAPCSTDLDQKMDVVIPGGPNVQYTSGRLILTIGTTTITSKRNGATESKTYP